MGNQIQLYHHATTFGLSSGVQYSSAQEDPPFVCFRCGVCCTRYQIRLGLIEARRIVDELGLTWDEFLNGYVDQHWPGSEDFLLRRCNGACVFLENVEGGNMTRCLIHPFKPYACREWNPSLYRRQCQEGLKYWGLTVSTSGQLEGSEQKLRDFSFFIESCKRTVQ